MKKLIILLALVTMNLQAQNGLSASVLHDVKLGLGLDKQHNNSKSVLDVIINLNLEAKQKEYHYFALQLQYEQANLQDGAFSRYSVHGIWTFETLIVDDLKLGFGAGLGMINRPENEGNGSYSFTIDVSYPIARNLRLISKNEWVRRSDVETPFTGYNLSVGINYKFFRK